MQHFSTIFVCGTFFLEYPIGLRFCRTHLDNYQISEINPGSFHGFGPSSFTHSSSLLSGEAVGLPCQNWRIPSLK